MADSNNAWDKVFNRVKLEPAVLAGLLGTIAVALGSAVTWQAAVPLIVGAIIRFFVTPSPDDVGL